LRLRAAATKKSTRRADKAFIYLKDKSLKASSYILNFKVSTLRIGVQTAVQFFYNYFLSGAKD
jgi:hypothetical protein